MTPPPQADDEPAGAPDTDPPRADSTLAQVRVLRQFRLVFNTIKSHFREVERRAGIGGAQVWALSVVRAHPRIGLRALAAAMDIHQTTASNLVKALAAGGLIAVERNGPDRRAVQLTIRPAGEAVLRQVPGPFEGVLPQALAGLDADTLRRLERDLAVLIEALDTDAQAAGIPLAQL